MPAEILGPIGLTVAALIAVGVLWREHVKDDADDRAERDAWKALALNQGQDIRKLTDVVESAVDVFLGRKP